MVKNFFMDIEIAEGIMATIGADLRGLLLALVEVYQALGDMANTLKSLKELIKLEPDQLFYFR